LLAGPLLKLLFLCSVPLQDGHDIVPIIRSRIRHGRAAAKVRGVDVGAVPDLSDTRVVVEDAFAVGDRVVGRYTYRARHTGPFVGIPASGADIIMRSIDIWRFDNDRFVEHWDELNLLEVFQQMGAISMQHGATR
jgi:predicted ester cyclase